MTIFSVQTIQFYIFFKTCFQISALAFVKTLYMLYYLFTLLYTSKNIKTPISHLFFSSKLSMDLILFKIVLMLHSLYKIISKLGLQILKPQILYKVFQLVYCIFNYVCYFDTKMLEVFIQPNIVLLNDCLIAAIHRKNVQSLE